MLNYLLELSQNKSLFIWSFKHKILMEEMMNCDKNDGYEEIILW